MSRKSNPSLFNKKQFCVCSVIAALSLFTTNSLLAASDTWTGGGGTDNWSDGANWNPAAAPSANDLLFFGGSTRLTPNNNLTAGTIFNNIVFNSGAGAFTIGGNAIVLTNGNNAGSGI